MNTKLDQLANEGKWDEIIKLIEQIPEADRSWETIGLYVRALNNNEQAERAIKIFLQYRERGANDPLWLYRYGYALWWLSRADEALDVLLRAKELAGDNNELSGWIDGLLIAARSDKRSAESNVRGLVNEDEEDKEEAVTKLTCSDDVKIHKDSKRIAVWFYNENPRPLAIGDKMCEINENAYMNGYNWDALFNYYLAKHAPDVLEGMESDPEAGSYMAHYSLTPENEARAEKFVQIIISLIDNEEELYRIVREEGDEIEWD